MKRTDAPFFDEEQRTLIKEHLLKGADDFEVARFLITCERTGLDPFSRQIYGRIQNTKIPARGNQPERWVQNVVIITSIDGFRAIAERSGEYAGQTAPEWFYLNPDTGKSEWQDVFLAKRDGKGNLLTTLDACRVGVKRKGWDAPVFGVANFDSFAVYEKKRSNNNGPEEWYLGKFWNKMPEHMIAKVAEAQAFRKAFPLLAQGLYVEEEIRDPEDDDGIPPKRTVEETLPGAITVSAPTPEQRAESVGSAPASSEVATGVQTPPTQEKPAGEAPAKKKRESKPKPDAAAAPSTPATAPAATETLKDLQSMPDAPWDESTPPAKTEPGPFGEPEPVKQATAATPPKGGWQDHTVTQITIGEFFNKRLGDLSPALIKRAYVDWALKYGEKIKASGKPERIKEAEMITAAYNATK